MKLRYSPYFLTLALAATGSPRGAQGGQGIAAQANQSFSSFFR